MATVDESSRSQGSEHPPLLFVDLDGTVLKGDLLWEGLMGLLRSAPLKLLAVPFWLARGRARLKHRIAENQEIEPRFLPYRQPVLDHIRAAREAGREVGLASASPMLWVRAVAEELGGFDWVLASDHHTNLKGAAKLEAIEQQAEGQPFEYVGDSRADLPIWRAAAQVTLVHPNRSLERGLRGVAGIQYLDVKAMDHWSAALREMRPVQWIKNGLVFAPIVLAHDWADPGRAASVILTFVAFCIVASVGYVLNDLLDLQSDRHHPIKCSRPLASGALPIPGALLLLFALACLFAIFATSLITWATTGMLLAYLALSLAYSFYFKQQMLLDVIVLAGLYTHRILTGGVAANVPVSPWLLVFSAFLFLSLALVKRFVELRSLAPEGDQLIERRAYRTGDVGTVEMIGVSCAAVSVFVLCLFVSSRDVTQLYNVPVLLWMMIPVMFYWITRVWMLARRGEIRGDPVLFASGDFSSYVCGVLLVLIVLVAARL